MPAQIDATWSSVGEWFLDQGLWFLLTLVVGFAVFWALKRWVPRRVRAIVARIRPDGEELERNVRTVSRIVLGIAVLLILTAMTVVILHISPLDVSSVVEAFRRAGVASGNWLGTHGLRIAIIVILATVCHQLVKRFIPQAVERAVVRGKRRRAREELKKRAETLSHFFTGVAAAVIWVAAGFMILSEVGVNIGPLLAGAGVAGIAIGFGAQNLIRDVLAGLFIILEDQYRKGDWVRIADIAGLVEQVGLRRTVLRDLDGTVHFVPNGEVKVASNFAREYSRANISVSVAYGEDLDRAMEVINRVGQEMAADEHWGARLLTPPRALRGGQVGGLGN